MQLQDQLLDTWTKERRTVLFITHDVDEAVYLAGRVVVMAARPGRVHRIVDVDLPYPRTEEIRLSAEFARIRNDVWTQATTSRRPTPPPDLPPPSTPLHTPPHPTSEGTHPR
ncbi:hypothetical protein SANTM175S_05596 [Streptomyces antimycoticus]